MKCYETKDMLTNPRRTYMAQNRSSKASDNSASQGNAEFGHVGHGFLCLF